MENNRECYHCASNHPELALSFHASDFGFDPTALTEDERAEAQELATAYAERTAAWETCGLPSEAVNIYKGAETPFRTQRLIIAGNGESQTIDQRAASRIPLGTTRNLDVGDMHVWSANAWNHIMGDHAVCLTVVPLTADTAMVRTKWLVHKDAVEGVDYDLEHLTSVWVSTNSEDADLVRRTQLGVKGAGYRPGPYSRFTETTVDDFTTWYVERMIAHGYAD